MNCKPGDLARYVGEDLSKHGWIVRCLEIDPLGELLTGDVCWVVDPPMPRTDGEGMARAVRDRVLRPIRDPGDDAQDETLSWKPVPHGEEQTA